MRARGHQGGFALEFARRDSCADDGPDLFTSEILDCIEPSGGTRDGWGCAPRT